MKKTKFLLSLLVLAVLAISCSKERLQDVSTERILPEMTDTDDSFFELEEGYLQDESAILQALNMDVASSSRSSKEKKINPYIYTLSNETSGNKVIAYKSGDDGKLTKLGEYPTGGTGTGGGLGNQGAISLSYLQNFMYVVNAGSNDISFFLVLKDGTLRFVNKVASGGTRPVSITSRLSMVYVVNAGSDNISGFAHNQKGKLAALSNSTQSLSGMGTGAAQISYSDKGRALIVTEKATNKITSFVLNNMGRPMMGQSFPSAGMTPFGYSFVGYDRFVVSEAAGGAMGASTISTYEVDAQGMVSLVSGPFATGETAACWVALGDDPRHLFVTNTGSGTISSLSQRYDGKISLANGGEATSTGGGPIDAVTDDDTEHLYVLASGADAIYSYKIGKNGALSQIDVDSVVDGANGLAIKDH